MVELKKGDCLELMKEFPDKSVDVSFTSPPYNRKRNDKYEFYDDTLSDYFGFLCSFTDELLRITKNHVFVNLQKNYYNKQDVFEYIGKYAKQIKEIIIWEKTNPMPASGKNITNSYEFFIVMGDKPLKGNRTYTKNIISTSVNSNMPKEHKAVMKQDVSDWFIDNFTKENDVVLDCFMGTGTTGVSCIKSNRSFIGIELDENYYRFAQERIEKAKTAYQVGCING